MRLSFVPILAAVAIWACGSSPLESGPPPAVLAIALDTTAGPIFRHLNVTLARPGNVAVTYWLERGGPRLQVITDSVAAAQRVFLPRLRAQERYNYEVRSVSAQALASGAQSGQFITGALPADLARLQLTATGTPTQPLTMIELMITTTGFNGALIADESGQIVWYWRTRSQINGVSRLKNGNFVMLSDSGLVELTPDARLVGQLQNGAAKPYGLIHHDALVTAGGTTVLFLARDTKVIRDTSVVGEAIWEWTPASGAVTKKWSAFDHFNWITDRGAQSAPPNWMHANSISIGAHGNLIVSLRNLDEVFSISPDFRSIEWRLGGPQPTIQLSAADKFLSQHSAVEVSPNRVLLFDNGFSPTATRNWSRAIEYQLDLTNRRASKVWEYRPQPDIYAMRVGSVTRLSNGNTIVAFGWGQGPDLFAYPITAREVTPGGNVAFALTAKRPEFDRVYRMKPLMDIGGERIVN